MSSVLIEKDPLTERSLRIWSAGDYDRISAGFRGEAEVFVGRRAIGPGDRVLDAACGSGNVTIPAARSGARVTGLDLVGPLLSRANAWSVQEGLTIDFDQGSVEALPYADESFDTVLSMFGVMFAPRPARVIAELGRVTRPGGIVALANWTRQGFVGRMLALHAAYVPPPPGVASPLAWGDPDVIRDWFSERAWSVTTAPRTLMFRYACPPADTANLFAEAYGPTVRTLEALDETRREDFRAELRAMWEQNHAGGAGTLVAAEYLEVVATRR